MTKPTYLQFKRSFKRTTIALAKSFVTEELKQQVVPADERQSQSRSNSAQNIDAPRSVSPNLTADSVTSQPHHPVNSEPDRGTVFSPLPPPPSFIGSDEEYSADQLVGFLYEGQIARVNVYLDSLDVEQRKKISSEMSRLMETK